MTTLHEHEAQRGGRSGIRMRWIVLAGVALAVIAIVVLLVVYAGGGGGGGGGGY